jgi:hypothetical protein
MVRTEQLAWRDDLLADLRQELVVGGLGDLPLQNPQKRSPVTASRGDRA